MAKLCNNCFFKHLNKRDLLKTCKVDAKTNDYLSYISGMVKVGSKDRFEHFKQGIYYYLASTCNVYKEE